MMAHPDREDAVRRILGQLDVDVCPVVWDCGRDRWDTGRRAMLSYDLTATHHAVIQDDVLVCRDLVAGLERAVAKADRGAPLCGYIGRLRPEKDTVLSAVTQARKVGASFITMHTLNWGPVVVMPIPDILPMIAHCDTLAEIANYDRRMSRYWELQRHVRIWYTFPCVVDHADGPSLVPKRVGTDRATLPHTRIAHEFAGEEVSALSLNWDGPVVHAPGPDRDLGVTRRASTIGMKARGAVYRPAGR
jgi:hypothetical protein